MVQQPADGKDEKQPRVRGQHAGMRDGEDVGGDQVGQGGQRLAEALMPECAATSGQHVAAEEPWEHSLEMQETGANLPPETTDGVKCRYWPKQVRPEFRSAHTQSDRYHGRDVNEDIKKTIRNQPEKGRRSHSKANVLASQRPQPPRRLLFHRDEPRLRLRAQRQPVHDEIAEHDARQHVRHKLQPRLRSAPAAAVHVLGLPLRAQTARVAAQRESLPELPRQPDLPRLAVATPTSGEGGELGRVQPREDSVLDEPEPVDDEDQEKGRLPRRRRPDEGPGALEHAVRGGGERREAERACKNGIPGEE